MVLPKGFGTLPDPAFPGGRSMKPQLSRVARRALTGLAMGAAGLLAVGCGSSGSPGASAGSGSAPAKGTPAAATLPAGALGQPGTIRFCSDISSPPLEFYANGQEPTGSDIDLGNAIAAHLGVKAEWVNTA